MRRSGTILCIVALLYFPAGCDVDVPYALHAVTGQLGQTLTAVPIEEAINSGNLSEEQIRKLRLILEAHEFAHTQLGLYIDNSFHTFYDSGDRPAVTNVSASSKDRFEPVLWTFPFVGTLPHLGFFDVGSAKAKADELRSQGFDVYSYEVDAYTNGEPLQNAVLSRLLLRSDEDIVDLVFHELLHATISRPNDASFNESLATFAGKFGATQFFLMKAGASSPELSAAYERYDDRDRFRAFVLATYGELDAFYAEQFRDPEETILARKPLFEAAIARFNTTIKPLMNHPERYDFVKTLELNNAYLLLFRRYNLDLDVFEQVLAKQNGNWRLAMNVFRGAARSEGDAFEYLRNWPNVNFSKEKLLDDTSTTQLSGCVAIPQD